MVGQMIPNQVGYKPHTKSQASKYEVASTCVDVQPQTRQQATPIGSLIYNHWGFKHRVHDVHANECRALARVAGTQRLAPSGRCWWCLPPVRSAPQLWPARRCGLGGRAPPCASPPQPRVWWSNRSGRRVNTRVWAATFPGKHSSGRILERPCLKRIRHAWASHSDVGRDCLSW